jgi:hypothetical protein
MAPPPRRVIQREPRPACKAAGAIPIGGKVVKAPATDGTSEED